MSCFLVKYFMIVYFAMDITNCFCFDKEFASLKVFKKILRFKENFHGNKCEEGRKMFQIL